jgi:hypothetical protein
MRQERDKGLLSVPLGRGFQYTDSIGRKHRYHTPRRIRRKTGAFGCMVDCDQDEGKLLYGEGWDYAKYRDSESSGSHSIYAHAILNGTKTYVSIFCQCMCIGVLYFSVDVHEGQMRLHMSR